MADRASAGKQGRAGLGGVLFAVALGLGQVGCPSAADTLTNDNVLVATSVSVDPTSFLYDVPCANVPGAMQSYVATVTDVTDLKNPYTLPSSAALPCSQRVYFESVQVDHQYTAVVEGFEEPADALFPVGPGDRHMQTGPFGMRVNVKPRWTTVDGSSCNMGFDIAGNPNVTQFDIDMPIDECALRLKDNAVSPPAATIAVDPAATLGNLACSASGGTVTKFDVTPTDSSLKATTGIDCSAAMNLVFEGVKVGKQYRFTVDAYTGGTTATQRAACFATPESGVQVVAVCDPLAPIPSP